MTPSTRVETPTAKVSPSTTGNHDDSRDAKPFLVWSHRASIHHKGLRPVFLRLTGSTNSTGASHRLAGTANSMDVADRIVFPTKTRGRRRRGGVGAHPRNGDGGVRAHSRRGRRPFLNASSGEKPQCSSNSSSSLLSAFFISVTSTWRDRICPLSCPTVVIIDCIDDMSI